MNQLEYSDEVMEHFRKPHNMGEIEDADGIGKVGNPICGDVMHLYIKVENNVIVDVKFKTFGCVSAIASSSISTDIIKGKTIEEAKKMTKDDVLTELKGLPPVKIHCSVLAIEALHKAVEDYENRQKAKNMA